MKDTRKRRRNAASRRGYILILLISVIAALAVGIGVGMAVAGQKETPAPMAAPEATAPAMTAVPTDAPTAEPTEAPTAVITEAPTAELTEAPTAVPTESPTAVPTEAPTAEPTEAPTAVITESPTAVPTEAPTEAPTAVPTEVPTEAPTAVPTEAPAAAPANPMSGTGAEEAESVSIEDRRPLVHADRIRKVMNRAELPLSGVKIGIDPGHQEKGNSEKEPLAPGSSEMKAKVSSGTQGVATRVPEYVVNLDVSLMLRDALEALGAEVYMTREVHEIDISNVERAVMMNELGVDLVLRIHCNGSDNQNTKGISLFVKETGACAEESYLASEALLPAMAEATGARAMGIYKRDTYSGMNWSEVPSILVEMGFMSNPEEDRLLNDPEYQMKLVDGMVKGIADYMGRELNEE